MEMSIKKICKKVESYDDWLNNRKRLIIKDIDIDLDKPFTPENECDEFILNYFDNKRSLLRERLWVEVILWDT